MPTHQVVDRVSWLHLTDLNEPLCEGGHDVTHEIVAEGDGLSLQSLLLLTHHLAQLRTLGNTRTSVIAL